jgi:hypothetical protein
MFPNATTRQGVHEAIISLGGRTSERSRFSQAEKTATLTNRTVMNQVRDGYCEGITLDWVRGALLPKSRPDGTAAGRYTFDGNKGSRDLRQANAQIMFTNNQATYQNQWSNALRQQHTASNWYPALEAKFSGFASRIENSDLSRQEKNNRLRRLGELKAQEEVQIEDKRQVLADANTAFTRSPVMQKIWWGYSKALDDRLKNEREANGKSGGPSRGFSRLEVVVAKNPSLYSGGMREFSRTLLMDPGFQPSSAAQLCIAPPGGGGGHATAIMRLNNSTYIFFDPNFGTYVFAKPSELMAALIYLFREGYPNIAGQGHDAHSYEVNGQVTGRYAILRGRATPVPGPDQLLHQ